ncbi:hypothetical protein DOT_5763 [Desulfosporosinus sp. OT]|nr:hypothetical protein DOT_5763 [Desulfosporosinus sp. OT]
MDGDVVLFSFNHHLVAGFPNQLTQIEISESIAEFIGRRLGQFQ